VLPDPEADVEPDRESNADNLEGEDEDETVAPDTGTILKKVPKCTSWKVTKQHPLPPTVEKGPGKVIP